MNHKTFFLWIIGLSYLLSDYTPCQALVIHKIECHDPELRLTQSYSVSTVNKVFEAFKSSPLFWWSDKNNCEDRANAMCKILNNWGIENGKIWLFNRRNPSIKEDNSFKNGWGYHVAAFMILRKESGDLDTVVIDPASFTEESTPGNIEAWAAKIICSGTGYYMFTSHKTDQHNQNNPYCPISSGNWLDQIDRDSITSYKSATIGGLSGYNPKKWLLTFQYNTPKKLKLKWSQYQDLLNNKPVF